MPDISLARLSLHINKYVAISNDMYLPYYGKIIKAKLFLLLLLVSHLRLSLRSDDSDEGWLNNFTRTSTNAIYNTYRFTILDNTFILLSPTLTHEHIHKKNIKIFIRFNLKIYQLTCLSNVASSNKGERSFWVLFRA